MSLTKVTYSMIYGAPANVLDYGAVGDGVTDDTAAIVAAMAARPCVYLPAGTYKTTSTITIPGESVVFGDGDNTIIKPTSSANSFQCILQSAASQITDLCIDGSAATGQSAIGILCGNDAGSGDSNPTLARLLVKNFSGLNSVGIYIRKALRVVIEQCYIFQNYQGLYIYSPGGGYPTTTWVAHSTISNSVAEGVYYDNGYQICFDNCIFESNGKEGLKLFRGTGEAYLGKLTNCWFEDNQFGQPSRTSLYQLTVDANGGTGGMHLDNVFFLGDNTTAKSIYLNDVTFTSLSKVTIPNGVPNGIYADGTSVVTVLDNAGNFVTTQIKKENTAFVNMPVTFAQLANNSADDVGTFTATLVAGTSGSITLNNALCSYAKHGNVVTVSGQIDVASVSSPVGELYIGNLPFNVRNTGVQANAAASVAAYGFAGGFGAPPVVARALNTTSTIQINKISSGALAAMAGDVIGGVTICFQCTYFTV